MEELGEERMDAIVGRERVLRWAAPQCRVEIVQVAKALER